MRSVKTLLCFFLAVFCLFSLNIVKAADNRKPKVFINTASYLGQFVGSNFGLSRFSEIGKQKGFTVDQGAQTKLTSEVLDGIDIYVLTSPSFPFVDEDKQALREWIKNGGILIAFDWIDLKVSTFTRQFGFESNIDKVINETVNMVVPENSPLAGPLKLNSLQTNNVLPLTVLNPNKLQVLVEYDDGQAAFVRTITGTGDGEIIGIGASTILFDDNINGDIAKADNDKLIQNLFSYFRKRLLLDAVADLKLGSLKATGGDSFTPGEDMWLIAKINNVGKRDIDATRIAFYLEKGSIRVEIFSCPVPALNGNKKTKIKRHIFLPLKLNPGTYDLVAVIDPDLISDDVNVANNNAAAKKQIVIQ